MELINKILINQQEIESYFEKRNDPTGALHGIKHEEARPPEPEYKIAELHASVSTVIRLIVVKENTYYDRRGDMLVTFNDGAVYRCTYDQEAYTKMKIHLGSI